MSKGETVLTLRKLPWLGGMNSYNGCVSIQLGQKGWENEVMLSSLILGLKNALMLCGEGGIKDGRARATSPS